MADSKDTVRGYLADLLAVIEHSDKAIERQLDDQALTRIPGAHAVLNDVHMTLRGQLSGIQDRLEDLGGQTTLGTVKQAATSVTGFITGLYGMDRGETASRMLRDDYTALHFISICTTMLHTTALSLADSTTALLTRDYLHELPPLITSIADLIPQAVIAELAEEHLPISGDAAEVARDAYHEAWRGATTRGMSS
jgi:hypothetical protein